MKKSELRNIIRESINELMNEQMGRNPFSPSKSDLEKAARIINKQKTQVNPDKQKTQVDPEPTNVSEPIKEQAACDNTPQGTCAQQWMPSALANNFLPSNHACVGSNTFKGLHDNGSDSLLPVLDWQLWTQTWIQLYGSSFTTGPMSYGEISTFVNAYAVSAGISTSLRGQIKRKWAKAGWARCMGSTFVAYGQPVNWSGGNCNC